MANYFRLTISILCIIIISVGLGLQILFLPDILPQGNSCNVPSDCQSTEKCMTPQCINSKCIYKNKVCTTSSTCTSGVCDVNSGSCLFKSTTCPAGTDEGNLCIKHLCNATGNGECYKKVKNCTEEYLSLPEEQSRHARCNLWSCNTIFGVCVSSPLSTGLKCDSQHCINSTCDSGFCIDQPLCVSDNDPCNSVSCIENFTNPNNDYCYTEINSTFCPSQICYTRSCSNANCSYTKIPDCCTRDRDCETILQNYSYTTSTITESCTRYICIDFQCVEINIPDCCLSDAFCDDFDECTNDSCNITTNTCSHVEIEPCCTIDLDCNETCKNGTCNVTSRICSYVDAAINASCNPESWRSCSERNGLCDENSTCVVYDQDANCPADIGCASFSCISGECIFAPNVSYCPGIECQSDECLEDGNCSTTMSPAGTICSPSGCVDSQCNGEGFCNISGTIDCIPVNPCDIEYCNITTGLCNLNYTIPCASNSTCIAADCLGGECILIDTCTTSTSTACDNSTYISCYLQLINSSGICYWIPDPECPNMTRAAPVSLENSTNFESGNCSLCCPQITANTSSSSSSLTTSTITLSPSISTSSTTSTTTSTTTTNCIYSCCPDFICQCWDCIPSNLTGYCSNVATVNKTYSNFNINNFNGTLQNFCVQECISENYLDATWLEVLFS